MSPGSKALVCFSFVLCARSPQVAISRSYRSFRDNTLSQATYLLDPMTKEITKKKNNYSERSAYWPERHILSPSPFLRLSIGGSCPSFSPTENRFISTQTSPPRAALVFLPGVDHCLWRIYSWIRGITVTLRRRSP